MFNRKLIAAAVAVVGVQSALPAVAGEDCCFRLTPYYWAVGVDGDIQDNRGPGSSQINFNQSISDVTDNLDFNGSLMLEHRLGHWVNFFDADYTSTTNDDMDPDPKIWGNNPEINVDTQLYTLTTGYRVEMGEHSHVDLMVGARYAKMDVQLKAKGGAFAQNSIKGDGDLTDGIVMLRPRIALGRHWAFSPALSVGAGDSDLVWEAAPEFVYTNDCCNLEFRFGYRTVNYEYSENNVDLDFSIAGPMAGIGFAF